MSILFPAPDREVAVGLSPDWLRAKLETAGLRSINNMVDITNFVMLEIGQPLHAFDADKLKGEINVRPANKDERFLALDGKPTTPVRRIWSSLIRPRRLASAE